MPTLKIERNAQGVLFQQRPSALWRSFWHGVPTFLLRSASACPQTAELHLLAIVISWRCGAPSERESGCNFMQCRRSDERCATSQTPVAVDSGKFSPRKELKLRLVKDFAIPLGNCTPIPWQIFLPTLSLGKFQVCYLPETDLLVLCLW